MKLLLLCVVLLFITVHAWPNQWCDDHNKVSRYHGPPHHDEHDGHDKHDCHNKCHDNRKCHNKHEFDDKCHDNENEHDKHDCDEKCHDNDDKCPKSIPSILQPPTCIGTASYQQSQFIIQQNIGPVTIGLDSIYAQYDCNITNVDPSNANCRIPFPGSTINASCCCAVMYGAPESGASLTYLYKLKILSPSGVVSLQSEVLVPPYCPQPQDHPVVTEQDVNLLLSIPGTNDVVIANQFQALATPCGAITVNGFAQQPYILPPP